MESRTKVQFALEEVPEEVYGVKLSESTRIQLAEGKESPLIEGMVIEGKELRNAKLRLLRNSKGEPELAFNYQREQLIIPEKIADYTLTEDDKMRLTAGDKAGPARINGTEVYLQVDKELNSVTVISAKDISIKEIVALKHEKGILNIAGYKPDAQDVKDLVEGRELPAKVFEQDGKYFSARITLTDDDRGIVFKDVTTLTPSQAKELKERLNVQRDDNFSSMVMGSVVKSGVGVVENGENLVREAQTKAVIESGVNFVEQGRERERFVEGLHGRGLQPLGKVLSQAIDTDHLPAIERLYKTEGVRPSYEDVLKVCVSSDLDMRETHLFMLKMDDSNKDYSKKFDSFVGVDFSGIINNAEFDVGAKKYDRLVESVVEEGKEFREVYKVFVEEGVSFTEQGRENERFIDISEKNAINYPYEYERGKYEVVESSQMLDVILYDKEKNLYGVVFNDDKLVGVGEREACTEKMNEFQTNFTKEMGIEGETKGVEDILEREFEKKIYDEREPLRGEERERVEVSKNKELNSDKALVLVLGDKVNGVDTVEVKSGKHASEIVERAKGFEAKDRSYVYELYKIDKELLKNADFIQKDPDSNIHNDMLYAELKSKGELVVDFSQKKMVMDIPFVKNDQGGYEMRCVDAKEWDELKGVEGFSYKMEYRDIVNAIGRDEIILTREGIKFAEENGVGPSALGRFDYSQRELDELDRLNGRGIDRERGNVVEEVKVSEPEKKEEKEKVVESSVRETKEVKKEELNIKDKEFKQAFGEKNITKMNDMMKDGYKPSESLVRNLESMPGITANDRVALRTVTGIEPKQDLKGEKNQGGPTEKGKQIKIAPKEKGKEKNPKQEAASLIKEGISKLAHDM